MKDLNNIIIFLKLLNDKKFQNEKTISLNDLYFFFDKEKKFSLGLDKIFLFLFYYKKRIKEQNKKNFKEELIEKKYEDFLKEENNNLFKNFEIYDEKKFKDWRKKIEKESLEFQDKKEKENNKFKNIDFFGITFEHFQNYESLKNMNKKEKEGPYWFICRGNKKILKNENKDFVSIVGTRKLNLEKEKQCEKWIKKNLPKDKIIISGLANGSDILGHKIAKENNSKIVIFPGTDIFKEPIKNAYKGQIFNYALKNKNGILITDFFNELPIEKYYFKKIFLKRNNWMAKMANASYVVHFKGKSGTLSHLNFISKDNKTIYLSHNTYKDNYKNDEKDKTKFILENIKKNIKII